MQMSGNISVFKLTCRSEVMEIPPDFENSFEVGRPCGL